MWPAAGGMNLMHLWENSETTSRPCALDCTRLGTMENGRPGSNPSCASGLYQLMACPHGTPKKRDIRRVIPSPQMDTRVPPYSHRLLSPFRAAFSFHPGSRLQPCRLTGSATANRAFFEPTVDLVSNIAAACVQATLHTNGVPNMDRPECSFHTLDTDPLPSPKLVEVPQFKTRSLSDPPSS